MIEQFATFARVMPAWCHTWASALFAGRGHHAGKPRSWRHFRYGTEHIARAQAQAELAATNAVRLAQHGDADEYTKYLNALRTSAGLTR